MKNKGKMRRVTRLGLFVMALVFCLLSPVLGQEGEPETSATPMVVQTPEEPQTMGEMWEEKLSTEGSAESPNPVPTASELNFPESRDKAENWATEGQVGESTFFDKMIEVCWSLAFICLLVWGLGKLAQKFGVQKVGGAASASMIEVLEKKRLSPGRSVILMRVGPKVLAVAATEGGYETLTEFGADEFEKYKDSKVTRLPTEPEDAPPGEATTPSEIARHYLSIIPGTGGKK